MKDNRDKRKYDLWLDSLWEFAPKKKHLLLQKYGSSFHVWKYGLEDVRRSMEKTAGEREFMKTPEDGERLLTRLEEKNIQAVAWDDEEFPAQLKQIDLAPWMIYVQGKSELLTRRCVAVVGARKASEYGKNTAYAMGKRLAQTGTVVVSGMAVGIDAWAHRGALDDRKDSCEAANTVAVLACGVDVCYPAVNHRLYDEIQRCGALVSEFQPGVRPRSYYFPARNRLISGLSCASVVVEAAVRSGSLITAELAAEQGREVFAVPGSIDRIGSMGTNKLIKDGAGILISIEDLIDELGLETTGNVHWEEGEALGVDEKRIIKVLLQQGETTADQIASVTGLAPSKINGLVTILEMKGMISTAIGKIFLAKKFENLYNMPL